MTLSETLRTIRPADSAAAQKARQRWDGIAKPLRGLGLLEEALVRVAGATGSAQISLERRCVALFCADNGVVAEGVTQTGREITALVARNFCRGIASINRMARAAHADVLPVDIGIAVPVEEPGLRQAAVRRGTGNIAVGPAMSREEATRALEVGIDLACELAESGYQILAAGEMGIGNTTTSSAVASVLLGQPPAAVTGRGAGLTTEGLHRKVEVVQRAIACNAPDPDDPLGVLAALGGLDLAGMTGLFLGGALCRLPVVIDGFISGVAALLATRLCPDASGYLLASHASGEPAGQMVLQALGLEPVITARMCLGEGTGAAALLPLLDLALEVYRDGDTFGGIGMEAYRPLD